MAVKPLVLPQDVHREPVSKARRVRRQAATVAQCLPNEPEQEPVPPPPVLDMPESLPYVPDVTQLARLLRFQREQSHRRHRLQKQLYALQVSTARTTRLARVARSAQLTLAECIRSEDKNSFVNLFNALHDAAQIPTELTENFAQSADGPSPDTGGSPSFLCQVSESSRAYLLSLLTHVRRNGNFIAERLAALTHQELLALLPEHSLSRPSESVLTPSGNYMRTSRYLGYVVDGQTELVAQQRFGSPLELLAYGVLNIDESTEAVPRTEVWSVVCSRLLLEHVPGSEKFIPAVLDLCAQGDRWPGKRRLEVWILETLQRGAFLLETPSKQSFRARIEIRPAPNEEEMRAEAFYSGAVSSLLNLLGSESGPSVIPDAVVRMCAAIWRILPPGSGHQRGFARFVLTRWLFSPFFFDALGHDMLLGHYISENARSRILREIASRAQKAIFDVAYAWKLGNSVPPSTVSRVDSIAARFQDNSGPNSNGRPRPTAVDHSGKDIRYLVLSAADMKAFLTALFPQRRAHSLGSQLDFAQTGLQSSSSSVSGFSLFRTAEPMATTAAGFQSENQTQRPLSVLSHDEVGTNVNRTAFAGLDFLETALPTEQAVTDEAHSSLDDLLSARAQADNHWAVLEVDPSTGAIHEGRDSLSVMSDGLPNSDDCQFEPEVVPAVSSTVGCAIRSLAFLPPSHCQTLEDIYAAILDVIEMHISTAKEAQDFVGAHHWFERLRSFRLWLDMGLNLDPLRKVIEDMESEAYLRLNIDELTADSYEVELPQIRKIYGSATATLRARTRVAKQLRDKMWYVADVRTTSAYDQARSIAGALRIMGKPKRPSRTRMAPPLRHWSGSRIATTNFHLKSEAQILELLSTLPEQGGPNKLSDEQAHLVNQWLVTNRIENLCEGEERLHRLCMEIRRCVDDLIKEGSPMQSSPLFERDLVQKHSTTSTGSLSVLRATNGRFQPLTLQTYGAPSIESMSSVAYPLSSASSRDLNESRSPTLTHRSSAPFWSPAVTDAQSPSSATSVGSYHTHIKPTDPSAGRERTETSHNSEQPDDLSEVLIGLLLSDLTAVLFSDGSETDLAYWRDTAGTLVTNHLSQMDWPQGERPVVHFHEQPTTFDWENTFSTLLKSFAVTASPFEKLTVLHQVNQLLPLFARSQSITSGSVKRDCANHGTSTGLNAAPPLQEDTHISGFRRLFCTGRYRPAAIFRDMQYIAALVPADILETTPLGKAFCNAAVAIGSLKHEMRTLLVETADSIIAYNANKRGHGRSSSTAQLQRDSATFTAPSRTPSAEEVSKYTMADAAEFLQITAKEGHAVAQRELATLYLTHPDLMDHVVAPFAKPKEVFKEELEGKWKKQQDPYKCDPTTMCVAHHWMSLSSKGGDALAKEYLRAREEMERFP